MCVKKFTKVKGKMPPALCAKTKRLQLDKTLCSWWFCGHEGLEQLSGKRTVIMPVEQR